MVTEGDRGVRRLCLARACGLVAGAALASSCTFPDIGFANGEAGGGSSGSGTSTLASSTGPSTSLASSGGGEGVGASSPTSGNGGSGAASSGSSGGGGASTSPSSSSGGGAGGGEPPLLGLAHTFAVLGGSAVSNVGLTNIVGDLGVSPGTSITGIPRGMPVGTDHGSGAIADQAQFDATMAYNALMVPACDETLPTAELGGLTLGPGTYCFGAAAVQLTGPLILDAQGDPSARFVFRIGAALTTSSFASVTLVDGATACDVYWLVGSSATIGEGSLFAGTILAYAAISLLPGVTLIGRAIARTAELSMNADSISIASCVD